jgi:hypothetical protein
MILCMVNVRVQVTCEGLYEANESVGGVKMKIQGKSEGTRRLLHQGVLLLQGGQHVKDVTRSLTATDSPSNYRLEKVSSERRVQRSNNSNNSYSHPFQRLPTSLAVSMNVPACRLGLTTVVKLQSPGLFVTKIEKGWHTVGIQHLSSAVLLLQHRAQYRWGSRTLLR